MKATSEFTNLQIPIYCKDPMKNDTLPKGELRKRKRRYSPRLIATMEVEVPEEYLRKVPEEYWKYRKLFKGELDSGLPEHGPWDHEIPIKEGEQPKFFPIYNLNAEQLRELKAYIDENLKKGYIQPSTSPAGYPIFFVPKPNGKLRPCIDYRQLNEITIKNRYPLPLISELQDRLQGAQWFTALDLKGAYNLIRIKKGEEWKTAFRTRYGHYEYKVMPFGLTNAPASFQTMINHVLREHLDIFVVAYLDDILIFSKTEEEHREHVHKVLKALEEARMLVEPDKSYFHTKEVDFLGYTIKPGKICMQRKKIEAVLDWATPTTVTEVRGFLGFANFYRRFLKNYSKVVRPLTDLTKQEQEWKWTKECTEAFEEVKRQIASEPVLTIADPNKPFEIETDASDFALGAQLGQRDELGRLHPVSFMSKKLTGPELRYPLPDKELMAIVEALKDWRHLLIGAKHQILIRSDHKNLSSFTKKQDLNKRQARWTQELASYDFKIVHVKGTENGRADALSRKTEYFQKVPKETQTVLYQEQDGSLRQLAATYQVLYDTTWIHQLVQGYEQEQENIAKMAEQGQLRYEEPLWKRNNKVFVPEGICEELITRIHESPMHGHPGIHKTIKKIQQEYDTPNLKKHVKKVIERCNVCAKSKARRHRPYGELQPLPVPKKPWESVTMDFIVKLPESKDPATGTKYDSILVVVDRLTKYAYFIPFREATDATQLAYVFLRMVAANHHLPEEIITDRGSTFASKFWRSLMDQLGVDHKLSTAYHPQTDGQTERLNQIVETYLRMYLNWEQDNWVALLPTAQIAYNSSTVESTGTSPFYANYGIQPNTQYSPRNARTEVEKARLQAEKMRELHEELANQLQFVRERMARYANNRRIEGPTFRRGEKVYLATRNLRTNRPSAKLDFKYEGPFKIEKQVSPVNYELRLPEGSRLHPVFHVSLLEPATNDTPIQDTIEVQAEEEEYEVEKILDSEWKERQIKYLVKWKNYPNAENSWEPIENLTNCQGQLDQFHRRNPDRPQRGPTNQNPERPSPPRQRHPRTGGRQHTAGARSQRYRRPRGR